MVEVSRSAPPDPTEPFGQAFTGNRELDAAEVHVWPVTLVRPCEQVRSLLSLDELNRADRFRFPQDRDHFTMARGALRRILASYVDTDPRALRFEYSAHGKPRLAEPRSGDFRFNLSHSHGRALIVVAKGREVGVDIEYVRRKVADERIAERFFSSAEVQSLFSLPKSGQSAAFFRCWTRKEAYLKARGDGISYGLHHFTVSVGPDEPPALLANSLHPNEVKRWSLRSVDVGTEYAACVVAEGADWQLVFQTMDQSTRSQDDWD